MSEACGRAAGRPGVRVAQRDSGVRAGTCLPREPGGAAGGASTRQPGAGPGAAPPAPALENRYACALMWGEHDPREAWQAKPTASPERSRVGCRPAVRPFRVGVVRSVGPRGLAAAARGLQRRALAPHVWTDRPEEVEGAVLGGGEPLISGGVGSSPGGLLGGGAAGGEGRDSESQAQRPAVPGVPPCLYPAPAVRSGSEESWGVATAPSTAARLTDFLPWRMLALCCARLPRLVTRGGRALGMRLV